MNRTRWLASINTVNLHFCLPAIVVVAAALVPGAVAAGEGDAECMTTVSAQRGHATTKRSIAAASRVYLNPNGGQLRAGAEDSSHSRSEVLAMRGLGTVRVPAWSRGQSQWRELVQCVQERFDKYGVAVVDDRPSDGEYIMAMVGGRPSMLGLGGSVGGIAPYNGRVIDDGVVFVFEQNIGTSRARCEATAHEIGHVLGLDHSTDCRDLMSYGSCGPKEFVDDSAVCGEFSGRSCSAGGTTQNSHAQLASAVGLAPPPASRPSPGAAARPPNPRPQTRGPAIARRLPRTPGNHPAAPRIQIQSAARSQRGDSRYTVALRARDADGIARVELLWTDGIRAYRLQCGRDHGVLPVRCARRGDQYTFALDVGQGDRAFAVRVTDGRGVSAISRPRVVKLY